MKKYQNIYDKINNSSCDTNFHSNKKKKRKEKERKKERKKHTFCLEKMNSKFTDTNTNVTTDEN